MKIAEIREFTTEELKERLASDKEKLVRMKLTHHVSPLENPSELKALRKTIARMNTELSLREKNN